MRGDTWAILMGETCGDLVVVGDMAGDLLGKNEDEEWGDLAGENEPPGEEEE